MAFIKGTNFDNKIDGTWDTDYIWGFEGNDTIFTEGETITSMPVSEMITSLAIRAKSICMAMAATIGSGALVAMIISTAAPATTSCTAIRARMSCGVASTTTGSRSSGGTAIFRTPIASWILSL